MGRKSIVGKKCIFVVGKKCIISCRPTKNALLKPHVAEHRGHEVPRSSGCLERGDQPHPPSEKVDVHLQKVVAGARYRKLDEVEADAAAAARRFGKRVEQAVGRQIVGFRAGSDVLIDGARPPYRAAR